MNIIIGLCKNACVYICACTCLCVPLYACVCLCLCVSLTLCICVCLCVCACVTRLPVRYYYSTSLQRPPLSVTAREASHYHTPEQWTPTTTSASPQPPLHPLTSPSSPLPLRRSKTCSRQTAVVMTAADARGSWRRLPLCEWRRAAGGGRRDS